MIHTSVGGMTNARQYSLPCGGSLWKMGGLGEGQERGGKEISSTGTLVHLKHVSESNEDVIVTRIPYSKFHCNYRSDKTGVEISFLLNLIILNPDNQAAIQYTSEDSAQIVKSSQFSPTTPLFAKQGFSQLAKQGFSRSAKQGFSQLAKQGFSQSAKQGFSRSLLCPHRNVCYDIQ